MFLGRDFNTSKNYSEATAFKIDSEIKRIVDEGYALAKKTLNDNMAKLHFIAAYLVKYEVMDGDQFAYVMDHDEVTDEDLQRIVEERAKQSAEENRAAKEEEERLAREKREDSDTDGDDGDGDVGNGGDGEVGH